MNDLRDELRTQSLLDLVSAVKDLVVVQGLAVKANGLAKLNEYEILDLENTIRRNMK